jgi:hypothetical protein
MLVQPLALDGLVFGDLCEDVFSAEGAGFAELVLVSEVDIACDPIPDLILLDIKRGVHILGLELYGHSITERSVSLIHGEGNGSSVDGL